MVQLLMRLYKHLVSEGIIGKTVNLVVGAAAVKVMEWSVEKMFNNISKETTQEKKIKAGEKYYGILKDYAKRIDMPITSVNTIFQHEYFADRVGLEPASYIELMVRIGLE